MISDSAGLLESPYLGISDTLPLGHTYSRDHTIMLISERLGSFLTELICNMRPTNW